MRPGARRARTSSSAGATRAWTTRCSGCSPPAGCPRPVTTCAALEGVPYTPLPPEDADGYDDAWATVELLLTELLGPTFEAWPGSEPLELGCPEGGVAEYSVTRGGRVEIALDGCAWTPDVPVDGTVEVADGGYGDASMAVTLPFAELQLAEDGRLDGRFRGEPVE